MELPEGGFLQDTGVYHVGDFWHDASDGPHGDEPQQWETVVWNAIETDLWRGNGVESWTESAGV